MEKLLRAFTSTLLITFALLAGDSAKSQQSLIQVNGWNAYVHLPSDYSTSKVYPTIIEFPGTGEVGSNPALVIEYGPGAYIAQGWNGNIGSVEFIVISLQPSAAYPAVSITNAAIASLKALYKIDSHNLFLTGYSEGGWCSSMFVSGDPVGGPYTYASQIKAICTVEGVRPDDNPDYPNGFIGFAKSGGKDLCLEQVNDARDGGTVVNEMNNTVANSADFYQTNFSGGGHCCWSNFYGGGGTTPGVFPIFGTNQNIYQWFASLVLNGQGDIPPVANAGSNILTNLPTGSGLGVTTSVTLTGSGSDADGTIASYKWSQLSGPVTGTIVSPTSSSTVVNSLIAGVYQFVLTVTDNQGETGKSTVQVTINEPPSANAGGDQAITLPASSVTLSGSGTDADGTISSYKWTKASGPSSGTITNPVAASTTVTALVAGIYKFALTVTDNDGATGSDTMQITVGTPAAPVITSAATASGTVGSAFSYTITASNTPTSYGATGLPSGLSVNTATGVISGTPTAAAVSNVTISATNAGGTGSKTLIITIKLPSPVISSPATATGTVGSAFSYTITASNTPTSYGATGLPSGLTVNTSTGVISGTPTAAAVTNVTISATNAGGTGSKTLTITINPPAPVITSAATASGKVGSAFSYTITASNTPTSYGATGLPAGLSVNTSTGVISGTPTAAAVTNVTISATNAGGIGSKTLIITINPAAPVITSAATASGTKGVAFSYTITASNNPTSYGATGLPTGLTVNTSTGVISGTPTIVAVSTVTISATNAGGTGSKTLTITISNSVPPAPVITSGATATGTVGSAFSYTITASNTPTSYGATGLPSGLSVNTSTGVISGTPTAAAVTNVTISATNAGGTGSKTLTITINPAAPVITSAATASGTKGVAFSYTITASNNPTSYGATGLPTGLTVNTSTGVISGTPTIVAVSTVTISATNAGGTGSKTLTITINNSAPPAPVITSAATASGTVGSAFSYTITASNTPTSYGATGLPSGLSVNTSTGVISGTPTAAAVSNVTISATNAGGTGSKTLTITINPAAPVITSAGTASGTKGVAFSYTITASNTPTSYGASGLPSGLSVNTSTGVISGTPTAAAVSTVTISANNAGGTGSKTLIITIDTLGGTNQPPVADAGDNNSLTWALTTNNTVISSGPVNGGLMIPGLNFAATAAYNTSGLECKLSTNWPTVATDNDNVDFPLLPNAGIDFTITGVSFTAKTSGSSGSNLFSLAYQKDGAGAWIPFGTVQTALSGTSTDISFAGLNQLLLNGHTYALRLYIYAATASTTSSRNVYIKDVSLTGTSAIDITLPLSTITLTGKGTDADGTIASYKWAKISGPVAGTITTPTSAITTVTGLVKGVYQFQLTVTDNDGAVGKDTIQVTVNAVGGREESQIVGGINSANDVQVYPNPIRNMLNAKASILKTNQNAGITVTDMTGRILYKTDKYITQQNTDIQIDMSRFNRGIYLLNVNVDGKNITRKVVKE